MSTIETPPQDRLPVETIVTQYDERLIRDAIQRELTVDGLVMRYRTRPEIDGLPETSGDNGDANPLGAMDRLRRAERLGPRRLVPVHGLGRPVERLGRPRLRRAQVAEGPRQRSGQHQPRREAGERRR